MVAFSAAQLCKETPLLVEAVGGPKKNAGWFQIRLVDGNQKSKIKSPVEGVW